MLPEMLDFLIVIIALVVVIIIKIIGTNGTRIQLRSIIAQRYCILPQYAKKSMWL